MLVYDDKFYRKKKSASFEYTQKLNESIKVLLYSHIRHIFLHQFGNMYCSGLSRNENKQEVAHIYGLFMLLFFLSFGCRKVL